MASPWELKVDSLNAGADLFTLPAYAAGTTPFVLPETVSITAAANGGGASISFEVIQSNTNGTPWFATSIFPDNSRVRFFDTRYSGATPIAMGFITSITAELLPSGQGTRATVNAQDPTAWLEKIVLRRGKVGSSVQNVGPYKTTGTADQSIITEILGVVNALASGSYTEDAATKLIFNASTAPTYYGASTSLSAGSPSFGRQTFEPQTLASAIDTVRGLAEGFDGKIRRYWVDANARLNYGITGTAPANPTAPVEIITSGTQVVGSSAATTQVFANSIKVSLDHNAQVDRIFTRAASYQSDLDRGRGSGTAGPYTTGNTVDPYVRTAGSAAPTGPGTAFARPTGPRSEKMFEMSQFRGLNNSNRADYIDRFTGATFALNAVPKRTISVSIAGAIGTATSSPDLSYGFVQGYTGGSPYTLTKTIAAGQYIKLTAPALNLSGLFRIESLTYSFRTGSTIVDLDLELEFRKKGLREIILGEG
jgi:hypothetical protein